MDLLAYHVLHEGRRMGPYDRRTIVGLRIRKTLTSDQELEASDGSRLTVGDLIGHQRPATDFNPLRSGGSTSARLTCSASVIESGAGRVIPAFRGEVELRVHADVLRIAGVHRSGLRVKDGRVKLSVREVAHVRAEGPRVDLWLGGAGAPSASPSLQRLSLDLHSESAASELLKWLPDAKPWPEAAAAPVARGASNAAVSPLLWASVVGIVLVAAFLLLVLLRPRF